MPANNNAKPPMFSVIIPVYNDGRMLAKCLTRLSTSLYRDFTIVVVDDASMDDTAEIARFYSVTLIRMERHSGPAVARNAGAGSARGEYLVFIDADVFVHPDTLGHLARAFAADRTIDAVFGSYDVYPEAANFISHYKNLFHHYVHQTSREEASTFWSGCGAVKRDVFLAAGGFDPVFTRPAVEDIELGIRLRRAGHRIRLNKQIQVTHAKRWSLGSLMRSDIWDRAIPWTELILRERCLPNDLNLNWAQRCSAALAWCLFAVMTVALVQRPLLLVIPFLVLALVLAIDLWSAHTRIPGPARWAGVLVMLSACGLAGLVARELALVSLLLCAGIVCLNAGFYGFFVRERHPLFALAVFPLHLLYYAYSVVAFSMTVGWHLVRQSWRALFPARSISDEHERDSNCISLPRSVS